MTTTPTRHATSPARYAPAVYRRHLLIGTPAHVANVLARHRSAGTLAAATPPRPAPGRQVWVQLTIRETVTPPQVRAWATRPAPTHRHGRSAAVVAVIAAPAVGVIAATAYLLGQVVELITAHAAQIAGLALIAALTAALLAGGRRRRHCPGC